MANTQLAKLVSDYSPTGMWREVAGILEALPHEVDMAVLHAVWNDTVALFEGRFAGYQACNNAYHDLDHTLEVVLTQARLIHGAVLTGHEFRARCILLGMVSSLFHDIGFIQSQSDTEGTGAKYTAVHEERGIEFLENYLPGKGFDADDIAACRAMLQVTNLRQPFNEVKFPTEQIRLLAQLLATSDILAQMASRSYLEKLPYLYIEFKEAGVGDYKSELDLLERTIGFWNFIQDRLQGPLGGVHELSRLHFRERHGIDKNLYLDSIKMQIDYLQDVLENHREDYREHLQRDGLMQRLADLENQDVFPFNLNSRG